jgi:hypothetical protein
MRNGDRLRLMTGTPDEVKAMLDSEDTDDGNGGDP